MLLNCALDSAALLSRVLPFFCISIEKLLLEPLGKLFGHSLSRRRFVSYSFAPALDPLVPQQLAAFFI